jgi:hypothetical protein
VTQNRNDQHLIEDPLEWGRQLIASHDHDPLYSGLARVLQHGMADRDRIRRYFLTYWCCYNVGASWWISEYEGREYWDKLRVAAENNTPTPIKGVARWPRGGERRHWRGQKCVDGVDWLATHYRKPEDAVKPLEQLRSLKEVETEVMKWPMFGPWIAFKAADMLERVLEVPVVFPNAVTTMYAEPLKGAKIAAPLMGLDTPQEVSDLMLEEYEKMYAPPFGDRRCGVQEVETVLCKWKSAYKSGHYYLGKDTHEHTIELQKWGAQELLQCYPTGVVHKGMVA